MKMLLKLLLNILLRPQKDSDLALENLALRQQLAIWKRHKKRPQIRTKDRLFWIMLCRFWSSWQEPLIVVKPEIVIRWHRKGFKLFWKFKSRRKGPGRPSISPEIRDLILKMANAKPLWGAPRIHGELLKLGIEVSERTVSNLMPSRLTTPPSQTWRTLSHEEHDFNRFLHGSDRHFPAPVRAGNPQPQSPASRLFQSSFEPHDHVDCPTDHRGVSMGHDAKVSAEGSGLDLRSVFPSTC